MTVPHHLRPTPRLPFCYSRIIIRRTTKDYSRVASPATGLCVQGTGPAPHGTPPGACWRLAGDGMLRSSRTPVTYSCRPTPSPQEGVRADTHAVRFSVASVPGGHTVHASRPAAAACMPEGQSVHEVAAGNGANVPAGHSVQAVALGSGACAPGAHGGHLVSRVALPGGALCPARHMHSASRVLARARVSLLPRHTVQNAVPELALYVPRGHASHTPASPHAWPAGHAQRAPDPWISDCGHCMHAVLFGTEYSSLAHLTQVCAWLVLYPARHTHCLGSATPRRVVVVFAVGHGTHGSSPNQSL